MDKVCIIIPVHNRLQYTIRCIQSLKSLDYENKDIVVVDDGSSDGTGDYLKECFSEVTTLQGDGNLWWSGATNIGIKYALKNNYDYVLLMNNDNKILDVNYLKNIVSSSKLNSDKIIGSVVKYIGKSNKYRFLGGKVKYLTGFTIFYDKNILDNVNDCYETEWLGGMGVLVPISLFSDYGLFDNVSFPHYSGDQEYWFRLQSYGKRILINKNCVIGLLDDDNTGKIGFKNKLSNLFRIKSHYNVIAQYRLMYKYIFKFYSPLAFILFYPINIIYYGLKKQR